MAHYCNRVFFAVAFALVAVACAASGAFLYIVASIQGETEEAVVKRGHGRDARYPGDAPNVATPNASLVVPIGKDPLATEDVLGFPVERPEHFGELTVIQRMYVRDIEAKIKKDWIGMAACLGAASITALLTALLHFCVIDLAKERRGISPNALGNIMGRQMPPARGGRHW